MSEMPTEFQVETQIESRVLVLGERAFALCIGAQLQALGFSPLYAFLLIDERGQGPQTIPGSDRERFILYWISTHSREFKWVHPGVSRWNTLSRLRELEAVCLPRKIQIFSVGSGVSWKFCNRLMLLDQASRLGIPVLVLNGIPLASPKELEAVLSKREVSFPLRLRSIFVEGTTDPAPGGGTEEWVLRGPLDAESLAALEVWQEQIRANAGEGLFFVERMPEATRRIELPCARFREGRQAKVQNFSPVDRSLTGRSGLILALAPADRLSGVALSKMKQFSEAILTKNDFFGLCSVFFQVDLDQVYLEGVYPHLLDTFPLWQKLSACDAIQLQGRILFGEAGFGERGERGDVSPLLSSLSDFPRFGALVKVLAVDALTEIPQVGKIHAIGLSGGVKGFLNQVAGELIGPHHSGALAWLEAYAHRRDELFFLAVRALEEFKLSASVKTNEKILHSLLNHPWVQNAMVHSDFLESEFVPPFRLDPVVLEQKRRFLEEHPLVHQENAWVVGRPVEGGLRTEACVLNPHGRVTSDGHAQDWLIRVGTDFFLERPRLDRSLKKTKGFVFRSLVTGTVHSIRLQKEAVSRPHLPLILIQSQGKLVSHALSSNQVRVTEWLVEVGETVFFGQELARVDEAGLHPF